MYEDIINLPHHVSKTRPQMSMLDRAAQFSPFAALTGYDAAIKETGRLTDEKIELDEDTKAALDMKQAYLIEMIDEQPEITIIYFLPDARKVGGAYVTVTGNLKRFDEYERLLIPVSYTHLILHPVRQSRVCVTIWKTMTPYL